jgi:23S rRNA (pseudouridine1915-N3)-methyltransferase
MNFRLILIGRTERGYVSEGFSHYAERIAHSGTFSTVVLPEAGKGDPAFKSKWEGEKILAALLPGEVFVALDERGKSMTSVAWPAARGLCCGRCLWS